MGEISDYHVEMYSSGKWGMPAGNYQSKEKKMAATKLKAIPPKNAEPSKPKIIIYGKPGVGKTFTSLDFPKCYYIDSENGASRKHYTDKLEKSGGVYMGVEQGSQDFNEIIEQVKALATEEHSYKTLIIDSITKLYNIEIAKEADRLGDKDAFGASKKPAIAYTRKLINWLDKLDMNVILIAHEKVLWANDKQVGVTYDAWDKLEYELDLCFNIIKQGESYKAFVKKSRLQGFESNSNFPWDYNEFADRYGKDIIEKESKQLVLATSEQVEEVKKLLDLVKIPEKDIEKWFTAAKAESWEEMESDKMDKVITHLKSKMKV